MYCAVSLNWDGQLSGLDDSDRFSVRDVGRDAAKPERMGKKYQWIALP